MVSHMTTQFSYDNWEYPPDDLTDDELAEMEQERNDAVEFTWEETKNRDE